MSAAHLAAEPPKVVRGNRQWLTLQHARCPDMGLSLESRILSALAAEKGIFRPMLRTETTGAGCWPARQIQAKLWRVWYRKVSRRPSYEIERSPYDPHKLRRRWCRLGCATIA